MTRRFEDDDVLMRVLAQALRETQPLAEGVAARGKSAFTWRTIDDDLQLAELMFDSAQEADPSYTRADVEHRVLVFTAALRSVEIELLSDRVVGQFLPPSAGEVEIEGDGGVLATVPVDELGFFVLEPVPTGAVRFRCTTPSTRLITDWVHL